MYLAHSSTVLALGDLIWNVGDFETSETMVRNSAHAEAEFEAVIPE